MDVFLIVSTITHKIIKINKNRRNSFDEEVETF